MALAITFLVYRGWGGRTEGRADNPGPLDWALAALAVVALGYTLVNFDAFVRRAVIPTAADVTFGVVTVLLVLEAARRTVGWILPAIVADFFGAKNVGAIIGVLYTSVALGTLVGPSGAGYLYDLFHSYFLSIAASAASSALAAAVTLAAVMRPPVQA